MKKSLALLAIGAASAASAQEWRFEVNSPVLSPSSPETAVTTSIDPGAGGGAKFSAALFGAVSLAAMRRRSRKEATV
jgi:hypothetical protein